MHTLTLRQAPGGWLLSGSEPLLLFPTLTEPGLMLTRLGWRASELCGVWVFTK